MWYYHKNAEHFNSDSDVISAMRSADEFAYSSRMTKGLSFDDNHFDVLTGYFTPHANLPRCGAQQLVRARNINLKSGFISISDIPRYESMHLPLQYPDVTKLCNSKELFSLDLLDY